MEEMVEFSLQDVDMRRQKNKNVSTHSSTSNSVVKSPTLENQERKIRSLAMETNVSERTFGMKHI